MLHCATTDQAHWSPCHCWTWPPQPTCHLKCRVPQLARLSQETPFFASQTVSVLNDTRNLWLPAAIICKANNGWYLVQVIGGGQYRHAHDHIQEFHSDAVKLYTFNLGNVAPAASTSAPATQAVALTTPVAPAATLQTPCKASPTVCSPQWTEMSSTGASLSQTDTAPAVQCWSTWSRKPPPRLLEEI